MLPSDECRLNRKKRVFKLIGGLPRMILSTRILRIFWSSVSISTQFPIDRLIFCTKPGVYHGKVSSLPILLLTNYIKLFWGHELWNFGSIITIYCYLQIVTLMATHSGWSLPFDCQPVLSLQMDCIYHPSVLSAVLGPLAVTQQLTPWDCWHNCLYLPYLSGWGYRGWAESRPWWNGNQYLSFSSHSLGDTKVIFSCSQRTMALFCPHW